MTDREEATWRATLPPGLAELDEVVEAWRRGLGERLVAVVLFGSRARGEAKEQSDWDVLLLARALPSRFWERLKMLKGMLPLQWRGRISLIAKTPEEFESGFSSLYLDLGVDGVVLYDPTGYAAAKLARIREIIGKLRLRRERHDWGDMWIWQDWPGPDWRIDWDV